MMSRALTCSLCEAQPVYGVQLILRPPRALYPEAPPILVPVPGLGFCKRHRHRVTVKELITETLWICIDRRCRAAGRPPPDRDTARLEFVPMSPEPAARA